MQHESVAKRAKLEFLVNDRGDAMLLHMGPLKSGYEWVQYDDYTGTIQFIMPGGDVQELGMVVPKPIKEVLDKTRALTFLELNPDFSLRAHKLVVFNKVLN
ncbi:MAG: hypothetical protein WBK77_03955 [Alphaproteobacteria bacterium]